MVTTSTTNSDYRIKIPVFIFVIPLAAFVLFQAMAFAKKSVDPPVSVDVVYTGHATAKHDEASDIRKCLKDKGIYQMWRSRSWRTPFKFFRLCVLQDGRIGMQVVEWSWTSWAWLEKTAFTPKNGTPFELREYLSAIAERII